MAVELYKYMQVVDDKARQLDDAAAASSPGVRRELNTSEGSVDGAGEPPDGGGGGGSEAFGYSQVSNPPGRPVFQAGEHDDDGGGRYQHPSTPPPKHRSLQNSSGR